MSILIQKRGSVHDVIAAAPPTDRLGPNGTLVVVGATMDAIEASPIQLIMGRRSIQGWASGIPTDPEDTLRFAELTGVRPMIEKYPLAKAAEGTRE
jgi:D-arabinose 1-dehydrogenase-like Zn-dependent alcohol dehydrogenase